MHPYTAIPAPRALRLALSLVAALAVLVLALPALPAAAADDDTVHWTVRTASGPLGADRTNFTYTLDPGASVTDALVITNRGDDPIDLAVYAADGYTSEDGGLSLIVAGERSTSVGVWTQPERGSVAVQPGESTTVPFTVSVPEGATPGDYAGGLVTSLTVPDAEEGVNVDRRLGIRVNLRVGGALTPSLAIEDASVSWDGGLNPFAGGDATITYTLHNTGNAAIAARPAAAVAGVFGIGGLDAPPADAATDLLPGESRTQTVTVSGVPPVLALFATTTVEPLVVDASGSTSPIAEVSATAVGAAIPWAALVIVLLLVAAAVLLRRRRRHMKAAERIREDSRVEAAVAAALAAARD